MAERLKNRKALVTGGSRGIGYAIAAELARHGAEIALLSRTKRHLQAAAKQMRGDVPGTDVHVVRADVRDIESVDSAVEEAVGAMGGLDILVNAAGVASLGDIDEMPPEEWRNIVNVNLLGAYHVTRAAWPAMQAGRYGRIIMIGSGSGRRAHDGWSAYCASKFGLLGLADALAKEGREHGISCNVVCPGPTDTDQRRSNFPGEDPSDLLKPNDVARACVFFASEDARWVSGPGIDVRREPI